MPIIPSWRVNWKAFQKGFDGSAYRAPCCEFFTSEEEAKGFAETLKAASLILKQATEELEISIVENK